MSTVSVEKPIAFKEGVDARQRGTKLEQSAITQLRPGSRQYDEFLAGYDSIDNLVSGANPIWERAMEPPLTEGEKALLKRLGRKPIMLYWGRNGWVPDSMPKGAKRADFDALRMRQPGLVDIQLAQLILINPDTE